MFKLNKITLLLLLMFVLTENYFAQQLLNSKTLIEFKRVSDPIFLKNNQVYYSVSQALIDENKFKNSYYTTDISAFQTELFTVMDNTIKPEIIKPFSKSNKLMFTQTSSNGITSFYSYSLDKKSIINGGNISSFQVDLKNESVSDFIISNDEKKMIIVTSSSVVSNDYLDKDFPKANFRNIDQLDYRHWDSWKDREIKNYIYAAELRNDSLINVKQIIKDADFAFEDLSLSLDKNFLLFSSKKIKGDAEVLSTNSDVYLLNMLNSELMNISDGRPGYDRGPKFSPDGNFISFLSMPTAGYESDRAALLVYDLKNKTISDPFVDFEEGIENYEWSADGKRIYFIAPYFGTEQIFEGVIATKKVRKVSTDMANYNSILINNKEIIASKTSMSYPKEIVKLDIEKGTEIRLTKHNDEMIAKIKWGKVEKSMIKTTDGKEMLVWVIYPPDFDKTKKYPALLYCQGGPQSMVSQNFSYRWNQQLMAAEGYVVIAPNRRGLPGFGRKWCDDIALNWGGQAIDDYLSAVDSVSKNSFIDKKRIGAVGASYGGYSVYYLAGKHQKRFKSFISHCGLFNLESWYTMTDEMFFSKHDIGVPYWENKTAYEKFSPHKYVQNWDTPIFIIHGEKDFRVPVSEGMQAFGAAKLKGLKTKMLLFPDEGHWVMKPQNSMVWHKEFYGWLKETME